MFLAFLWAAGSSGALAQIRDISVFTAGSFQPGLTRQGGLSVLFCNGLTGVTNVVAAPGFPLPTELQGISVLVNGRPAPILAIAPANGRQQINFQVPAQADLVRNTATVTVKQGTQTASTQVIDAFNSYPGDLFIDSRGYAIALRPDGSLISSQNPARRGETIVLYATGMGAVDPYVPIGQAAGSDTLSRLVLYQDEAAPSVVFCQSNSQCQNARSQVAADFAGLTPGTAGVYQINVKLPDTLPRGEMEMGLLRSNCLRASCPPQSQFLEVFESQRAKVSIQ